MAAAFTFLPCRARWLVCLGAAIFFAADAPLANAEDRIEDHLLVPAIKVMRYLQEKGYKNVGVLKFRVQKGSDPATFHAGPLNVAMANRLENALLTRNAKANPPIGILHEAFKIAAAKKQQASYLNPAGCAKLFDYKYPLAWGTEQVEADAFIAGLVQLSPDRRTTTIRIEVLDRASKKLSRVVSFDVKTDRGILVDVCEAFVLNSKKLQSMGLDQQEDEAVKNAKDRRGANPQAGSGDRLVDLDVLYDGKPQELQGTGDTEAMKTAPGEGQEIVFRIKNKSDKRVGVVLAVNGKSTLYEEDLDETRLENLAKWVLEPGTTYELKGFYQDKSYSPFKVLSEDESLKIDEQTPEKARLGQFNMIVFQEGAESTAPMLKSQGLRKATPVAKNRPKTAAEAAELAQKTASRGMQALGFIRADNATRPADLQGAQLRNPTVQESRVIAYQGRKEKQ